MVASEVQSVPMEVESASGQSNDMAKDTQTQCDEQTFKGSDGKDCVEPSSASGQPEPPFALVVEHLNPKTPVKTVLDVFASYSSTNVCHCTGHKGLMPGVMSRMNVFD